MQQAQRSEHRLWLRRAARLAVFCLLVLLMVALLDQLLCDKGGTIRGFYEEPKNSIDVLFIGGSHANAAFAPTRIFEQEGFTSYVLYSWSQPVWTSYHYLKEGLKTQTPKVVVLDAFGLTYGHTYMTDLQINATSDQYSMLIRPGYNRLRLALAMSACQTNHRPFTDYFSLFQFHNRWKALSEKDWLWFLQNDATTGKGYGPLYTTEAFPPQQMPPDTAENELMEEPCERYLRRFFALAEQEGFSLVVTALPYECTAEEYGIYAKAARLCAENGVPFLNYFDPATAAEAGFDWASQMAEHAHVNYKGAEAISAHIAAWLAERYALPDHRADPAYADWQRSAQIENADRARMDLRMTADLAGILQKAEENGCLVALTARGDLAQSGAQTTEGFAAVRGAFAAAGLDTTVLDTPGGCGLYLYGPGTGWQQQTAPPGAEAPLTAEARLADFLPAEPSPVGSGPDEAHALLTASVNSAAAEVWFGGEQVALGHDGVSVVVVEPVTGRLVQSICFNASDGYAPYTD